MKHFLRKGSYIYQFNTSNKPIITISDGDTIEVETADCFEDQINDERYVIDSLDWNRINPATGPIYIEGAEPGDILQIDIQKIDINNVATMLTGKDMGVLGDELKGNAISRYEIKDEYIIFSKDIKIPINKMIGVIGTTPKEAVISCGTPDYHGGNMDCKEITEGAKLFLPVEVKGALLALGDLHAAMGDGEVCVSGGEVSGVVTIKVDVIKGKKLPTPMIINSKKIITLSSKKTLDEASIEATKLMVYFMMEEANMSKEEAIFLLSLKGDLRICQIVDPNKTVRMEISKEYLKFNSK